MKAIRKKPGCEPEIIDIDNTLAALQAEVGGYIEAVTLPYGAALICNEEGRFRGLPYNCCAFGTSIHVDEPDFRGSIARERLMSLWNRRVTHDD